MIRVRVKDVEAQAARRPAGYVADVLSRGRVADGWVEWEEDIWRELVERYADHTLPDVGRMVAGLGWALARWAAAGFAVVSAEDYAARRAACRRCMHWKAGLVGRCAICGCTALKPWLATERCPLAADKRPW